MKIDNHKEVPLEDVEEEEASRVKVRWLISEDDGAPNFAMRMFEVSPGGYTPLHSHPWEHEVYITSGSGKVFRDQEYVPVEEGDFVFIRPNEEHQFKNDGNSTLKFLCLIPITE